MSFLSPFDFLLCFWAASAVLRPELQPLHSRVTPSRVEGSIYKVGDWIQVGHIQGKYLSGPNLNIFKKINCILSKKKKKKSNIWEMILNMNARGIYGVLGLVSDIAWS